MRTYTFFLFGVLLLLLSPFYHAAALTEVSDDIEADATWTVADSPYVVTEPITVASGTTLTIGPGVVIKFDETAEINIEGSLVAEGTSADKIYFTSALDDSLAGDTDENGPQAIALENYWFGLHFDHSEHSSIKNAVFKYSFDTEIISSAMSLSDVEYNYVHVGLSVYDSTIEISNLFIHNLNGTGILSAEGSSVTLFNPIIEYKAFIALFIANGSSASVTGGSIISKGLDQDISAAVSVYDRSTFTADGTSISGGMGSGIELLFNSTLNLKNVIIQDFFTSGFCGIIVFADEWNLGEVDMINLENSKIINNKETGICAYMSDAKLIINSSKSTIAGNDIGVFYEGSQTVDMKHMWWGSPKGPYNENSNPSGQGDSVSDNVVFAPWLLREPGVKECCSSVMFFPGIEGSRLYKKGLLFGEDQLWEPNVPRDVADLYANDDGTSKNEVYTKDIINNTNIVGNKIAVKFIYKSLSNDFDQLVLEKRIHEWEPVAYDWRMGIESLVNDGIKLESDTMHMIAEVERIAANSETGKVTLTGHSNGGLLIKYLVKKLEEKGEADLVDKVILVGSPELGTPKGFLAILHGLKFSGFFNILAPQKYNRQLALNIAGAYSLIPSEKFFETNPAPLVEFDDSVGTFAGLINAYGKKVSTYSGMKDFILSKSDDRITPSFDVVDAPAIGNELIYGKAESLHNIIDNYTIPSGIKTYEISGTGLPTPSGVRYKKSNKYCLLLICTDSKFLLPEIINDVKGDSTVLNTSSSVLNGTQYFADFHSYNKDNQVNYDHAYMMENNSIRGLIENIIADVDDVPQYILEKNALPTIKTKIIAMHSPVDIDVYDAEGRHTGKCAENPYPEMECVDEEIPNSGYTEMGEDKYITVPDESTYTLQLDGYDTGTFTLTIDSYENNSHVKGVLFENVPTTSDTTSTVTLGNVLPTEILLDNNNDNSPV
jgi:hypothetical protein